MAYQYHFQNITFNMGCSLECLLDLVGKCMFPSSCCLVYDNSGQCHENMYRLK